MTIILVLCLFACVASGQQQFQQQQGTAAAGANAAEQETGPRFARIIKQINQVNEDGSYTVGYKADDGSFKLETRTPTGDTEGAYGYVDANGELRTVRYKAGNGTGFAAVGPGIPEFAGEAPSVGGFEDPLASTQRQVSAQPQRQPFSNQQFQPQQFSRPAPQPPRPAPRPQQVFRPQPQQAAFPQRPPPQQAFRPQPQPQAFRPQQPPPGAFRPQPAGGFRPQQFNGPAAGPGGPVARPLIDFNNLSNEILGNEIDLGGPAQFVGINPAFQRPRPVPQAPRPQARAFPRPQPQRFPPAQGFQQRNPSDTPIFRSSSAPQPTPNQLVALQRQQDELSARNNPNRPAFNIPPFFNNRQPQFNPGFNRPGSQFNLSPGRPIN